MTVIFQRTKRHGARASRSEKRKTPPGDRLELMLRAHGIGGWQREYRFHPTRQWRFDFAWPNALAGEQWKHDLATGETLNHMFSLRFAIEIEGISGGMRPVACRSCGKAAHCCGKTVLAIAPSGHQTAKGMREDMEKYHEALRLGWIVYRTHQDEVESQQVIEVIRQFVGRGGAMPALQTGLDLQEQPEEAPF